MSLWSSRWFFSRWYKSGRLTPWVRRRSGLAIIALEDRTLPAAHPLFLAAAVNYNVGSSPNSVATGDFNGDGKLDMAAANFLGSNVSVLLGKGDGTFFPAVNYAGGPNNRGVFVGDFNNDTKLDLATSNQSLSNPATGGLSILLGNGNGTFQSPIQTNIATVGHATAAVTWLSLAYLDGDNNLDVVTGNSGDNSVSVLLGQGNGHFQAPVFLNTGLGSTPFTGTVADFNNDGNPDIVTSNSGTSLLGTTLKVFLGTGNGTTYNPGLTLTTNAGPGIAVVNDFDGDNNLDLAVQCYTSGDTDVLLGNGNGTFQPKTTYHVAANTSSMNQGDFDSDGIVDLLVTNAPPPAGTPTAGLVYVLRGNGNGTFQAPVAFAIGLNPGATGVGDFDGDSQVDIGASNDGSNTVSVLLNRSAATHFTLTAPLGVTAGGPFNATVTALNGANAVDVGYAGLVQFTGGGAGASLPANSSLTNGTGLFPVTLITAGSQTITATDTVQAGLTASATISVSPAAAATFVVTASPSLIIAGGITNLTVVAKDTFGNTASGYSGTVHFTGGGAGASLPANTSLASGTGSFPATLITAGNQTVNAVDTLNATIGGSTTIQVDPAAASKFIVTAVPSSITAGASTTLTVVAEDFYGNTATGYAGTVQFSGGGAGALLPAPSGLSAGTGMFPATLVTTGTQTIAAKDGSITGSVSINVSPAAAASFVVTANPTTITAGDSATVAVTAKDAYGNIATGYGGTVQVTGGVNQPSGTLTAGTGSFLVQLTAAGNHTLTATDTVNPALSDSAAVTVNPAAATHFAVSASPGTITAGDTTTLTVTAKDQFENMATGYAGLVHFSGGGTGASLPGNSSLAAGNGTFPATLITAGNQMLTAADSVNSTITGSANVTVLAAAASSFLITASPNTITAGGSSNLTVTAKDPYGNTADGYSGTVNFSGGGAGATLPPSSTLSLGTGIFPISLIVAGNQTVTAQDSANASLVSSVSINVTPAAATHFKVTALPSLITAGGSTNLTVTAKDQFENTATGYSGVVQFSGGGAGATLPPNSLLSAGTGTFPVTLITAGNQTISAKDSANAVITGSASVQVSPAAAAKFDVSASPTSVVAGNTTTIQVTAKDIYGNVATGYSGNPLITGGGSGATIPLTANVVGGSGSFGATLVTAGTQTIVVTDGAVSGSATVNVSPAAASQFVLTGVPPTVVAGSPFTVTVTAKDQYGNLATSFGGTVSISSTDGAAVPPTSATLSGGTGTFSVTLKTAGTWTITATSGSISKTSAPILVTPGAASQFVLSGPPSATLGAPVAISITAKDAFGNVATGFTGLVVITSSDPQANLPGPTTLTNGVGSVVVTFLNPGSQTVTGSSSSITGTSPGILVSTTPTGPVHHGQTATIGFWHNNNGQALINSFNGGPTATSLSSWLSSAFPRLYGTLAGTNNLTGKTNAQVAAYYLTLFNAQGQKLEAQVMATALAVYATTQSLGGSAAAAYGFQVTVAGVGSSTFNVGANWAAFGAPINSTRTVLQLLQATNAAAVGGVLYNGNSSLRNQANSVFTGINEAGDI
ncbi:MAG: beta strand repeat-containing protein [Gemmataceae bacterium]